MFYARKEVWTLRRVPCYPPISAGSLLSFEQGRYTGLGTERAGPLPGLPPAMAGNHPTSSGSVWDPRPERGPGESTRAVVLGPWAEVPVAGFQAVPVAMRL